MAGSLVTPSLSKHDLTPRGELCSSCLAPSIRGRGAGPPAAASAARLRTVDPELLIKASRPPTNAGSLITFPPGPLSPAELPGPFIIRPLFYSNSGSGRRAPRENCRRSSSLKVRAISIANGRASSQAGVPEAAGEPPPPPPPPPHGRKPHRSALRL